MSATVVKCPTCNREVVWNEQAKFRPFCSERCKTIDLGAWASGGYSIAGSESGVATTDDGSDAPPATKH
jgi:endogenous inhibitor of DNA gyrase (YacG/DUF329 family)